MEELFKKQTWKVTYLEFDNNCKVDEKKRSEIVDAIDVVSANALVVRDKLRFVISVEIVEE